MKPTSRWWMLLLVPAMTGCTTLQSFSMTQVPKERTHRIEAHASTGGLFGIFFSNDFVNEVSDELRTKCPNGRITGVVTKHENTLYVIWLSRKITASAYCMPADTAQAAPAAGVPR